MSGDIAAFMICVDCQVQSHQLDEFVVLTVSHEVSEIEAVVLVLFNRGEYSVFVDVTIDSGCDGGELGNEGH